MEELDMSGVDPLRYAEMRKRVATITEFIAIEKPTAADREVSAKRLEVGTKQFMRLVSAWRTAGEAARPCDLDGATGGKGQRRAKRGGLSDQARTLVADAIAAKGSDSPLKSVVAGVRELAQQRMMRAPSRSSVWNMLMEARSIATMAPGGEGLTVGSIQAEVPVRVGGAIIRPTISLAISAADGTIHDHSVSFDPHRPARLGDPLGKSGASEGYSPEAPLIEDVNLPRMLGNRIGRMRIVHHGKLAAPAAALVRSRRDDLVRERRPVKPVRDG